MHTTADTAPARLSAFWRRHSPTFEKGMLVFNVALFVFCVADWRGWLPFERGYQPLRMVYLSGALALQPLASLLRQRSMLLTFLLLGLSMALLATAMTVGS
jgi:hypothetical protein